MFVFVYGTLKRDYGNHHILEGAADLGDAVTAGSYRLFAAGFPVMRWPVHYYSPANAPVRGEVYHFTNTDILHRLDQLESEGRMYHRTLISVKLNDMRQTLRVFTYIGDTQFRSHRRSQLYKVQPDGCYVWQPDAELKHRKGN